MRDATLIDYIDRGATLVCATERLARELRARFNARQRERGQRCWAMPPIHGYQRFTEQQWLSLWPEAVIAHPVQLTRIYRQVIAASDDARALLSRERIATLAEQAGALLRRYQILLQDTRFAEASEAAAFARWERAARERLREHGLIPQAAVTERLLAHGRAFTDCTWVVFVGFTHLQPLQAAYAERLARDGVRVEHYDLATPEPGAVRLARQPDTDAELDAAARQLAEWLAPYRDAPLNAPSIALVVPGVDSRRAALEARLRRHLAAASDHPGEGDAPPPWQFVRGTPLADDEIVASALAALTLARHANPLETVGRVLLAPRFAGAQTEWVDRGRLDYALRCAGSDRVSLASLIDHAREHTPVLHQRLRQLDRELRAHNKPTRPSQWARRLRRRLELLGWPGDARLTSASFQARETLLEQLDALAGFDAITGELHHSEAVALLRELCEARIHLVRPDYWPPIQVIDLDDIAGHRYDKALAVGITADELPAQPKPSPLLPLALQRDVGMPAADPDIQLARAQRTTQALERLADEVRITAAEASASGQPITACTLFDAWPEAAEPAAVTDDEPATAAMEPTDERIPAVDDAERASLRGGVSILARYARQPFYAFSTARLGVEEWPEPVTGLSAIAQGELVHSVLHDVWGELRDSEALARCSHARRRALIDSAFWASVQASPTLAPAFARSRLARIERERVIEIVLAWLAFEETRRHPFRVALREQRLRTSIAGMELSVVLDRADEVDIDGTPHYLVWDYKTGIYTQASGWDPQALIEPQLPIYATRDELSALGLPRVDGIAFGVIDQARIESIAWTRFGKGVGERGKGRCISDWDGLLACWRDQLDTAAQAFLGGDARVDWPRLPTHARYHEHLNELIDQET